MATKIKEGKLLYHLTSIENLADILKDGLKPRALVNPNLDIADPEIIKVRRDNRIDNLVPFHFFAGTPFAGLVQKEHPESEFIYITVKRSVARKNQYKILSTHPLSQTTLTLHDYDSGIEDINWSLLEKRDYSDHDCRISCMAECLSPSVVHCKDFFSIYCPTDMVKTRVNRIKSEINNHICTFYVDVNDKMFV